MIQLKVTEIEEKTLSVIEALKKMDWWVDNYYSPMVKQFPDMACNEVDMLWKLFRQGGMLCELLSKIQNNVVKDYIKLDVLAQDPFGQELGNDNVIKFTNACCDHFFVYAASDFKTLQLYTDDLYTYYQCLEIVETVVKRIHPLNPPSLDPSEIFPVKPTTSENGKNESKRKNICDEMINTERVYVKKIEKIPELLTLLESKNLNDPIFNQAVLSINYFKSAINFQQIFLLNLEAEFRHNLSNRNIGKVFKKCISGRKSFEIYNEFCSNYRYTLKTVLEIIKPGNTNISASELPSYFIAPIQRICKYPLLMKEYLKTMDKSDPIYQDTVDGYEIAKDAAKKINQYSKASDLRYKSMDFVERIDNFDKEEAESFGSLKVAETVVFRYGDAVYDSYLAYVFEKVLFVCRPSIFEELGKKAIVDYFNSSVPLSLVADISITDIFDVAPESDLHNGKPSLKVAWYMNRETGNTKKITLQFSLQEQMDEFQKVLDELIQ